LHRDIDFVKALIRGLYGSAGPGCFYVKEASDNGVTIKNRSQIIWPYERIVFVEEGWPGPDSFIYLKK